MVSAKSSFQQAVTAHREAQGLLNAVRERLDGIGQRPRWSRQSAQEQAGLGERMTALAGRLAPGWLGVAWEDAGQSRLSVEQHGEPGQVSYVRIGDAHPLPGVAFPVVVPFIGAGHLVMELDARDPVAAAFLRSVLARTLASHPAGSIRVLPVDGGALGRPLAPFAPLVAAEVMGRPRTDLEGLRDILDEAEEQVRAVQAGELVDPDVLLVVCAGFPAGVTRTEYQRLVALAHAGPPARVHMLLLGYPPPKSVGWEKAPTLEVTTEITRAGTVELDGQVVPAWHADDPPLGAFGSGDRGLNAPLVLDGDPPRPLVEELCRSLALRATTEGRLTFDDLIPAKLWSESSAEGLQTAIGRVGREPAWLGLDDSTPHWLVGGRTGSGKTVFLLDALYGLLSRYSPDELALYLLDFKEGVSFAEFIPTVGDPSWIPHARTVGIESDRQYGVAVLADLVREMSRRAAFMKQAGVTKIADLRAARGDLAMPRIVSVIDEFHVLFEGNDETAKKAVALLEEVARKGRSYGIHLILASQSLSGIEALYTKGQSLFGQFGQRIALSGGGGTLDIHNHAADTLPMGQVILNDAGGVAAGNRRAKFPNADPASLRALRHRVWERRMPGSAAPSVFVGYAEHSIDADSTYRRLSPAVRRRTAYIGQAVDVGLPAVGLALEPAPGAHLAVLGTSAVGADILHAAALSLGRQHDPGTATFLLAGLAAVADPVVDATHAALSAEGHLCETLTLASFRDVLGRLAQQAQRDEPGAVAPGDRAYLVIFGADMASGVLKQIGEGTRRSGLEDLRQVLHDGPMHGVHVLGWWRGLRRFTDDLGSAGRDDVAGIVALNVNSSDLNALTKAYGAQWQPKPNRALFIDRQEDVRRLIVPFVRPGRYTEAET